MTSDNEPKNLQPVVMGRAWRLIATMLGFGGLGVGGTAVFVTDVEAGPVALLLVGLVFTFVAMSGRLPSRLKVGDSEAAWEAVQEYVEKTIEDVPPQEKPQALQRVTDLAAVAPQATSRALANVAYEEMVTGAVRHIAAELDLQVVQPRFDVAYDLVVEGRESDSPRLYIVVKSLVAGRSVRDYLTRLTKLVDRASERDRVLIITRGIEDTLPLEARADVLRFDSYDDIDSLRIALGDYYANRDVG